MDESAETVGKKVREAQLMKVPYTLVVGDREVEAGDEVSVRDREGREARGVPLQAFLDALLEEVRTRSLEPSRFGG